MSDRPLDSGGLIELVKRDDREGCQQMVLVHSPAVITAPCSQDQWTSLHYAACHRFEILRYLLSFGPNINVLNIDRKTPLFEAVSFGDVDCARLLLEHGADATIRDSRNRSPMDIAIQQGNAELVALLAGRA
eukprot:m.51891 g.51891  ORF g.51891 m.51891 type:complete len:132 (-) comp48381_c0_seq1:145-540(-)